MSGNAAQEITSLLERSISQVNEIVNTNGEKTSFLMKANVEKVDQGKETAEQCDEAFSQVVAQVGDVKRLTGEITSAIQEQTTGLQEINQAIGLFNTSTQENARAAGDVSLVAQRLHEQFVAVDGIMQELAELVHGA